MEIISTIEIDQFDKIKEHNDMLYHLGFSLNNRDIINGNLGNNTLGFFLIIFVWIPLTDDNPCMP